MDENEEETGPRYAEVGMVGIITDDQAALGNPYEVVWENGAWGFYTTEELNREAVFVMKFWVREE